MKKKILSLVFFSFLALATVVGAVSSSLAWFFAQAHINSGDLVLGSSFGAYFGGGDGSSDTPYEIYNRTHMYNLAWLQYMGLFNVKNDGTNTLTKQFYFKVMNDIDMGGMAIPPIGTEENPFLGNFNGNSKVISDFVVTNLVGENGITRKPTKVNASEIGDIKILGLFGVVGEINDSVTYSSQTNSIHDFALNDFSVKTVSSEALIGLAAGYVGATVDSVAIGDSHFNIASGTSAITVNGNKPYGDNLSNYGVVGYCEPDKLEKSKLVDIKADQPTLTEVGAGDLGNNWGASLPMEDIYNDINKYRANTYSKTVKYKSADHYYYDQNHDEIVGLRNATETDLPTQSVRSGTTTYYYQFRDYQLKNSSNQQYASYSYGYRTNNNASTTGDSVASAQFTYLYGKSTGSYSNAYTRHNHEYENRNAYTIDDGAGHYLSQNANTPTAVANADSAGATKWIIDGNYLYTQVVNGATETTYYLTYNGSLRLTTTRTTQWTYDDNEYSCRYNNNTYYLRYNNGWTATTTSPYITSGTGRYYIYSNTTRYLSANGTTGITNQNSQANATAWTASNGTSNDSYFYITSGGNNYYIRYDNGLKLGTSQTNAFYKNGNYLYNGSRYIRYNNGWTTTTGTNNRTSLTFVEETEITGKSYTTNRTSTTGSVRVDNTSTANATYETAPTYIPLKYERDSNDNPTDVSMENTGYIVSGANYSFAGNGMPGDIRVSYYPFDSLVNREFYPLQYTFANGNTHQESYSSDNAKYFEVITRTINSNGYKRISDFYNASITSGFNSTISGYAKQAEANFKFEKYNSARESFHKSMVGENENLSASNAYGLHFMDAVIDADHKIAVERASIQGSLYQFNEAENYSLKTWQENDLDEDGNPRYTDQGQPIKIDKSSYVDGKYELLEDCIDFKLNKNGTINFFAGTYFTGNNAFFSLNQVFRNTATVNRTINGETVSVSKENEIVDVKEISEVWSNSSYNPNDANPKPRYIYKYSDGKWLQNDGTVSTSTTKPENAQEKVFDLGWLTGAASDFDLKTACCYYFEIPVVTGEYALGAVEHKNGAYLMYLDIGASNISDEKMRAKEKIVIRTEYYLYPSGVSFVTLPTSNNAVQYISVTGNEGGTVIVPTSVSGDVAFSLENKVLKCGPPSGGGSLTSSTYKNEDIEIMTGSSYNTPLNLVVSSWKQETKEKSTTYSFDAANQKMYTTYSTKISTITDTNQTPVVSYENKPEDNVGEAMTSQEYAACKFVAYKPADTDIYVEYQYQSPYEESGGTETENVTFTYEVKYDVATGVYTYEFEFETTTAINVKVVILKSRMVSSTETYKIKINGSLYNQGETAKIVANNP